MARGCGTGLGLGRDARAYAAAIDILGCRPTDVPGVRTRSLNGDVMAKLFGEVPGNPVGSTFASRPALSQAQVHRPRIGGISGNGREGADSIVVSGGYIDDQDFGDELIYTGHGGNDPATKRQIADQELDAPGNAGLARSQLDGLPVRVIRGAGGDPAHSPPFGFRYDGLFRVTNHWSKTGRDGYRIWQFHLVQLGENETTTQSSEFQPPTGTTGPVPRITVVVQRQIRNSTIAEAVKRWHAYRCQVCGITLQVAAGPYAEGAHLRPLGRPHLGPDVPENVLCLCPNDHVRLDNGAIYLLDDFTIVDARTGRKLGVLHREYHHRIDRAYIQYHRELW
jgi:putative restriction endonuclease